MTLLEWRKSSGLSVRSAARHISETAGKSISHTQVDKLERGVNSPTIHTADVIRRGTGGAVVTWPGADGGRLVLSSQA
jgi:transcriptional regulator with XRE-family HTH domain